MKYEVTRGVGQCGSRLPEMGAKGWQEVHAGDQGALGTALLGDGVQGIAPVGGLKQSKHFVTGKNSMNSTLNDSIMSTITDNADLMWPLAEGAVIYQGTVGSWPLLKPPLL